MPASSLGPGLLVFLALGLIGAALVGLTDSRERRTQLALFVVAFAIRFGVSIVIYEFGLMQIVLEPDSTGWMAGRNIMRDWSDANLGLLDLPFEMAKAYDRGWGYYYLLALLFYLTGAPGELPAAALNGFASAVTVVLAYRIGHDVFNRHVAERAGWLICLFPSLIIWSAQPLKEPIVILLETLALYCCVTVRRVGLSWLAIGLCLATTFVLLGFRFYAAYVVMTVLALTVLMPRLRAFWSGHSPLAAIAVVLPLLIGSGFVAREQVRFEQFDVEYVESFRRAVATGQASRTGVELEYELDTPGGFSLALVSGAAHLLLAPFPWHLMSGNPRVIMTAPELLVWWWLIVAAVIPGLRLALRTRPPGLEPLLLFILGLGFLYSLMFGNIGLVYRQRAQLLPWLLILAGAGLWLREQRRKEALQFGPPLTPTLVRPAYRGALKRMPPRPRDNSIG